MDRPAGLDFVPAARGEELAQLLAGLEAPAAAAHEADDAGLGPDELAAALVAEGAEPVRSVEGIQRAAARRGPKSLFW